VICDPCLEGNCAMCEISECDHDCENNEPDFTMGTEEDLAENL
jgi:hypothetical protein